MVVKALIKRPVFAIPPYLKREIDNGKFYNRLQHDDEKCINEVCHGQHPTSSLIIMKNMKMTKIMVLRRLFRLESVL